MTKRQIELESEMVSDTVDLKWTIRNSARELLQETFRIASPTFKCFGYAFHLQMSMTHRDDEICLRLVQSDSADPCWISNCIIGFDSSGHSYYDSYKEQFVTLTKPANISYSVPACAMVEDCVIDNKLTARCTFTATTLKEMDVNKESSFSPVNKKSSFSPEHKKSSFSNSGPIELAESIGKVFEDRYLSDVTLKVGEDEFQAHKIILASRSSVFRGMFESDMRESQENVVQMIEMKASIAKEMLQYIYTGKIEKLSMDRALDLYVAADRYDLQELKGWCKDFLLQNISPHDVCGVLELAKLHSDEELAKTVRRVFKKESKVILASKEWRDLQRKNPVLYASLVESAILDES